MHAGVLGIGAQRCTNQLSPDVVQENVSHHFGGCYNGALGFVESAGVVLDVAHLPH